MLDLVSRYRCAEMTQLCTPIMASAHDNCYLEKMELLELCCHMHPILGGYVQSCTCILIGALRIHLAVQHTLSTKSMPDRGSVMRPG